MSKKQVVLVSPDGHEYVTSEAREVTRLKQRGYKVKAAPAPLNKAVDPKSTK